MTGRDKFDRLLDKGLSEYGNVSPRDGLEQRLLARLVEEPQRRPNWRWLRAAVPVMAAVLIAIFFSARPPTKSDTNVAKVPSPTTASPATSETTVAPPTPASHVAAARPEPRVQKAAIVARKEPQLAQPKLATFPSPDESEQQARMLLRFVTRSPSEAVQVASEQEEFQKLAEARMNQDLEIRPER